MQYWRGEYTDFMSLIKQHLKQYCCSKLIVFIPRLYIVIFKDRIFKPGSQVRSTGNILPVQVKV